MPRRKRCASPSFDDYEEEYDDELSSNGQQNKNYYQKSVDQTIGNLSALGSRNHQQPPIQRNAANARERARMRVLSSAFCRLKTKLPWVPADTKLSKLDTLRLATIYIQQLRASLSKEETDDEIFCQANAQSLVSYNLIAQNFLFFSI